MTRIYQTNDRHHIVGYEVEEIDKHLKIKIIHTIIKLLHVASSAMQSQNAVVSVYFTSKQYCFLPLHSRAVMHQIKEYKRKDSQPRRRVGIRELWL